MKNAIATTVCTKAEAKDLTDRIRDGIDQLWSLLLEAHDRRAWKALGYDTWEAYVSAEFNMSRRQSYRLLDQGRVIREIVDATDGNVSVPSQITKEIASGIKDDLPAVTTEIRERVQAGEKPDKATAEVIAAKRAEKEKAKREREAEQAKNDAAREQARAALPDKIKRGEEAKARNGSTHAAVAGTRAEHPDAIKAERDELREENAALKADVADRDRRLALFDDIAVQWEKGGFEAVRAVDLERIRNLKRQVEDISADRAKLAKSRDFWKKQALALGYVSPNAQPVEDEPKQVPDDSFGPDVAAPF